LTPGGYKPKAARWVKSLSTKMVVEPFNQSFLLYIAYS